ncbi:hypothetical protein L596_012357 [Steinernema carpocapsae]|uniref:Peptidase M16 N-terminal domain-containing protein n=1 Tax=Steinernema carpocapsae TaxID=34508 RepID=A0A4U5NWU3_STECR|nr:hypothetical protein L596_012357 [Steinernema carpocapsae]
MDRNKVVDHGKIDNGRNDDIEEVSLEAALKRCFDNTRQFSNEGDEEIKYEGIELPNKLKILLASSQKINTSVALTVYAGSLSDPADLPGLAHLCEHIVSFGGTEKYPEKNGFQNFVDHNGGRVDALTAQEYTTYVFAVEPELLAETLDRFVQLFKSPLLSEDFIQQEIESVHSEFSKNKPHHERRLRHLEKTLSRPGRENARFASGNRETLSTIPESKGIDVSQRLKEFFQAYYSANIMTLCVMSSTPLCELKEIVQGLQLEEIPNRNVKMKEYENPFTKAELGFRVDVVSLAYTRELRLFFPIKGTFMEDSLRWLKAKPEKYISYQFENPFKGYLLQELQKRNFASGCETHFENPVPNIAYFRLILPLTENGLKRVDKVVNLIFQYIASVKATGPQEWIYREVADMEKVKNPNSWHMAPGIISRALQKFAFEDIIHIPQMKTFDASLIAAFLGQLRPENMNYFVVSKKTVSLKNLKKEEYYEVEYSKRKLSVVEMGRLQEALEMPKESLFCPAQNQFIPTMRTSSFEPTKLSVEKHDFGQIWHQISKGKIEVVAYITFPPLNGHKCQVLLESYIEEFKARTKALNSIKLTGISAVFYVNKHNIVIWCSGYDKKVPGFLVGIIRKLVKFKTIPKNLSFNSSAAVQALTALDRICMGKCENSVYNEKMAEEYLDTLWKECRLDLSVKGLMTREESVKLKDYILEAILKEYPDCKPLPAEKIPVERYVKLEKGVSYICKLSNPNFVDSVVLFCIQLGEASTRHAVLLQLLVQISKPLAFTALRTTDQLGYEVYVTERYSEKAPMFVIYVRGEKDPNYVEERIEAFLYQFRVYLVELTPEGYEKHVNVLKTNILRKDSKTNMWLYQPNAQELFYDELWTEKNLAEVDELMKILYKDFIKFFDAKIAKSSFKRRKLVVSVSKTWKSEEGKEKNRFLIRDLLKFKAETNFYDNVE